MNNFKIINTQNGDVYDFTETEKVNLNTWMKDNLDQSIEYKVFKFEDPKEMKALKIIKRLCEYNNETYKKVLCFEFLQDINYHPEAKEIVKTFEDKYNFMSGLSLLSRKSSY